MLSFALLLTSESLAAKGVMDEEEEGRLTSTLFYDVDFVATKLALLQLFISTKCSFPSHILSVCLFVCFKRLTDTSDMVSHNSIATNRKTRKVTG